MVYMKRLMTCFETARLLVRHLTHDDLDDFTALNADTVAMQYMGDGEVLSRETCQKWIGICLEKYAKRGYGTSAVIEKATGNFVGFCGVIRTPENDYDEIIYALAQPYWGKGYATRGCLCGCWTMSLISPNWMRFMPRFTPIILPPRK